MPLPAPVTSAIRPLLLIAVMSSLDPARPKETAPYRVSGSVIAAAVLAQDRSSGVDFSAATVEDLFA
jgi:hypothetical protein